MTAHGKAIAVLNRETTPARRSRPSGITIGRWGGRHSWTEVNVVRDETLTTRRVVCGHCGGTGDEPDRDRMVRCVLCNGVGTREVAYRA